MLVGLVTYVFVSKLNDKIEKNQFKASDKQNPEIERPLQISFSQKYHSAILKGEKKCLKGVKVCRYLQTFTTYSCYVHVH